MVLEKLRVCEKGFPKISKFKKCKSAKNTINSKNAIGLNMFKHAWIYCVLAAVSSISDRKGVLSDVKEDDSNVTLAYNDEIHLQLRK